MQLRSPGTTALAFVAWMSLVPLAKDLQAQAGDLFREAAPTGSRTDPERWLDPLAGSSLRTIRTRMVRIDLGVLAVAQATTAAPAAASPPALRLNLFDDTVFLAHVEQSAPTQSGYVLSGSLQGVPFGTMALAVHGPVVAGSVRAPGATWRIRSVGAGLHVIQQVELPTLPPEAEPLIPPAPLARAAGPASRAPAAFAPAATDRNADGAASDNGSVIDVMVVYTSEARTREGGRAEIEALLDLWVAETNQAYAASGAIQRISLVRRDEVAYAETGDAGLDLDHLIDPLDGQMDGVHALRDAYAADIVHLIVGTSTGCGKAAVMATVDHWFESSAFGVVRSDCGSLLFAHELGHNMGLRHDRYMVWDSDVPFPYSAGYVNQRAFDAGAPASSRWRTVMSYPNQCSAAGFHCTALLRFSNPDQTYKGDPLGVPGSRPSTAVDGPADARRSLNRTRRTVANFRSSRDRTGCRPVLTPDRQFVPARGGAFEVTVTIRHDCTWRAVTSSAFVTITAGDNGAGPGVVRYRVAPNRSPTPRDARLRIAGRPVRIEQPGRGGRREGICDRTPQVHQAITRAAGVDNCWSVTSAHLAAVRVLDLSGQGIAVLHAGDFAGLPSLEALRLADNRLNRLPPTIFAGLASLKSLYLDDNGLRGLPPRVFAGLANLQSLGLTGNRLAVLPARVFAGVPNLESLRLWENDLARLPHRVFAGLTNLSGLYLGANRLTSLPEGVFDGLAGLDTLSLAANGLTTLPDGIFDGLTSLRALALGDNALRRLRPGTFRGLPTLDWLDLSNNRLTTLPRRAFAGLSGLTEFLSLAGNQLARLPGGVFASLSNLEGLWLFENRLTALPPGIFTGLSSLTNLELDPNPGAPFPITLRLVQTKRTATGGAVAIRVPTGAPFDLRVRLTASGGTLSATRALVRAGRTVSSEVTVTKSGPRVTVSPGPAPPIPRGARCGLPRCFKGLRLVVKGQVVLD